MNIFIEDEVIDPPPYSFALTFPSTYDKHECLDRVGDRDIDAWVFIDDWFSTYGKKIKYSRPDDFCRPSFIDKEFNAIAVLFHTYEDMGFGLAPPLPEECHTV